MARPGRLLALGLLLAVACDSGSRPAAPVATASAAPVAIASAAPSSAAPKAGALEAAGIGYVLRHTGGAEPTAELPLIVAIHGLGDRPESFARFAEELPLRARVVFPRGLTPHHSGFSWFPIRADAAGSVVASGIAEAAERLAAMLEALSARYPTRGKPVVTGFSQGGMLSFALAAQHPTAIARAVPIAGWLPPELVPKAGAYEAGSTPPIVALHGDADPVLPIEPTREAVAALVKAGFAAELEEYPGVGHTVTGAMRREAIRQLALGVQ